MLGEYVEQFKKFRVHAASGSEKPHKPLMLLAVIDMAERGALADNAIRYEDTLDTCREYADAICPDTRFDACFPFYHLRTSPFWTLDRDEHIRPSHIRMLGRSARLAPELHRLLCSDAVARAELRQALIERWFAEDADAVQRVIERRRSTNGYESLLRTSSAPVKSSRLADDARSSTFRRLVLEAYDFRCAATGWRIVVPGVPPLVDAAHLIPFAESRDDRPSNGIALTPTYHRALDRHLIAPGPDMKWHVSTVLDQRIPDNRPFLELSGQSVIFEGQRHQPSPNGLEWRLSRLLGNQGHHA